jgi:endonuclease/exonuclease/phosphatase family metal-dependent hydrolase
MSTAQTDSLPFSILQWNVWYKESPDNIVRFLTEHPADILCLQELVVDESAHVPHVPQFIAKQLGYNYFYKELPIESTDGKRVTLANGIFSRFPITKQYAAWINEPKGSGGYDDEYRTYVEVTLEISGQEVTIGTTHMSYTHHFKPTPNKKRETDMLVTKLRRNSERFIFTGDLNAEPGSYTIQSIEQVLPNAGPNTTQKTWTTKPFNYNNFNETNLNWRLDYVFATPDLQIVSTKIITTDYSDHLPILAQFSIKT